MIIICLVKIESQLRITVKFKYDQEIIRLMRSFEGATWSRRLGVWHLPPVLKTFEILLSQLPTLSYNDKLNEDIFRKKLVNIDKLVSLQIPQEYRDKLLLKRYSLNTIKNYEYAFKEFMEYFIDKEINNILKSEILLYLKYLVTNKKISSSYQNLVINSIKFYYEKVLGNGKEEYYLDRPTKEYKLPNVMAEEEIKLLLSTVSNLKHRCILMIIYSAGLRISECIGLKISDIDSKRMCIHIRSAKGKKDRLTLLSEKVLMALRKYYQEYHPEVYLFEGDKGQPYSIRSIQNIFKKAVFLAKIRKKVTVHSLRHSFATHLLESGVDVRYIQTLLGHNSSKTTEIYTHITKKGYEKLKSPFDNF